MPGGVDLGIRSRGPSQISPRPPVFSTPAPEPRPTPPPTETPTPPITSQEPTQEERRERRNFEQQIENLNRREPFQFKFWEPKADSSQFTEGMSLADIGQIAQDKAEIEFIQLTEFWDDFISKTQEKGKTPKNVFNETMKSMEGRHEEVFGAYTTLFLVMKNLEEHLGQYREYDPEAIAEVEGNANPGARYTATAIAKAGTLNPAQSVRNALEEISAQHPDDYTAYVSSNAGFAELMVNSLNRFYSIPQSEISILTPGASAGQAIDQTLPDIPYLKAGLISTVETLGDPSFIALTTLFPPAGIAAKAALALKVAGGMTAGEIAAEELGAPRIVGSLAGGIGAVAGPGFVRASIRNAVAKARANPVLGEPATTLLVNAGELPTNLSELGAKSGNRTVYYRGVSSETKAAFREGGFLVETEEEALRYAEASVKVEGGIAVVEPVVVQEGAIIPVRAGEGIAGTNSYRILNAKGVRPLGEGELPFPRLEGGSTGPSPEGFELKIKVHLERPESQDILRSAARQVAEKIPLGTGQRSIEILNRMALPEPGPGSLMNRAVKGAFGWIFQQGEDDAARFMAMTPFRGAAVPFIENAQAQIWLRGVPPKATKSVTSKVTITQRPPGLFGNLFRKGEGEWIAFGDVAESVMRGEKTYLGRLTNEQVDFIMRAQGTLDTFVGFAEQVTGLTLKKRQSYWPRFSIDPEANAYRVGGSTTRRIPALYERVFDSQQTAISEHGLKYRPSILNQMDSLIEGMQKLTRDGLLGGYLKKNKVLTTGSPRRGEVAANSLGVALKGRLNETQAGEILQIIGPSEAGKFTNFFATLNDILRLSLTGSADAGYGAIQMTTLMASPAGPAAWGRAMGKSFYTAIVDPKFFHRYMMRSRDARKYADYGGDLSLRTEVFRAAEEGALGLPKVPILTPIIDVATYIPRTIINRISIGMGSALAYGRVELFSAMADSVAKPGLLERAVGARALQGQALHEELFRLSRFTETLLGTPRLTGTITAGQHRWESAFVWFATRYTRSFLGTMSYMVGKGATPAQARATMARLLIGGASVMSGLIAGVGLAQGWKPEKIEEAIKTALNPLSGKKFMSLEMGGGWYGLGGTYRSGYALFFGIADKRNWDFENWEEWLVENPIIRGIRSRQSPVGQQLQSFAPSLAGLIQGDSDVHGEDFLGYEVNLDEFFTPWPNEKALDYAIQNFAPITLDAALNNRGDWRTRTAQFTAEFFGLRTSPKTDFETLEPVLNRVTQDRFGMDWNDLREANDSIALDEIRNHPDVLLVTEGQIRQIRERQTEKLYNEYREGRDRIHAEHLADRDRAEDSYTTAGSTGSTYREKYGVSRSNEYFANKEWTLAKLGEFADEEAPVGTVDYAMDIYYNLDIEDFRDKRTLRVDYEAWFAARDAALELLPDNREADVKEYLRRRESQVRRHMSDTFDSIITPNPDKNYFTVREQVAERYNINLNELEQLIIRRKTESDPGERVAPVDIGRDVDRVLNHFLGEEGQPSISDLRNRLRENDPRLDAELFRQGFTTSVRSERAQQWLIQLNRQFSDMGYFEAPLARNID